MNNLVSIQELLSFALTIRKQLAVTAHGLTLVIRAARPSVINVFLVSDSGFDCLISFCFLGCCRLRLFDLLSDTLRVLRQDSLR